MPRHRFPTARPSALGAIGAQAIKGIRVLSFRGGAVEPAWLRPGVARHAAECVLVAALAIQIARLVWAAVLPLGPIGHVAPTDTSSLAAASPGIFAGFDPFHRGGAAVVVAASSDAANGLRLFGVRVTGGGGSAIIAGPDGRQAAFAIGDTVAPGTILQAVAADHVILESGGRRSNLFFPRPDPGATGAVSAPLQPSPAGLSLPPAGLSIQTSLEPRLQNGRVNGFSVLPGGPAAQVIRDAGIQPGDVLLSVNGTALSTPEKASDLASQLATAGSTVVQYERGGQVNTATLKVARP